MRLLALKASSLPEPFFYHPMSCIICVFTSSENYRLQRFSRNMDHDVPLRSLDPQLNREPHASIFHRTTPRVIGPQYALQKEPRDTVSAAGMPSEGDSNDEPNLSIEPDVFDARFVSSAD
jgi:hypothetical protein